MKDRIVVKFSQILVDLEEESPKVLETVGKCGMRICAEAL